MSSQRSVLNTQHIDRLVFPKKNKKQKKVPKAVYTLFTHPAPLLKRFDSQVMSLLILLTAKGLIILLKLTLISMLYYVF